VAYARADYPAAKGHFEAGYLIKRDFQDAEGMALALTRLSEIAIAQGDYAEAKNLGGQSRALYQQIGDRGGLATAFNMLAQAALGLGEIDSARQLLGQALELALAIDYIACLLAIFYNAGHWLLETGETEPGLNLLALVQHHPATTQTTREQVLRLFDEAKSYLAPDLLAVSRAGSEATDLTAVGRDLFITLTESVQSLRADKPLGSEAFPSLVEPLSERELEVLQLLVDGLQNREIAARLTISLNTVKTHIGNIFGKLGVNSRVRAASRARELDLL
jgi:ATP/maltotriose-dependent transcriptional regulator MalT